MKKVVLSLTYVPNPFDEFPIGETIKDGIKYTVDESSVVISRKIDVKQIEMAFLMIQKTVEDERINGLPFHTATVSCGEHSVVYGMTQEHEGDYVVCIIGGASKDAIQRRLRTLRPPVMQVQLKATEDRLRVVFPSDVVYSTLESSFIDLPCFIYKMETKTK
ncbi:hypothetical protein [Enterovibrio calviensis]|uniref:hypothetical protein n=1 Tax=Enterovibrio calviensis TaxID=91359 RepID=UPI000485FF75|nr:hypothetical protein [Enterovibrio calviensis]